MLWVVDEFLRPSFMPTTDPFSIHKARLMQGFSQKHGTDFDKNSLLKQSKLTQKNINIKKKKIRVYLDSEFFILT
jgi:hypothetical protein